MHKRKVAFVDLAKEKVKVEPVPKELRRRFLGGRGINVYYLHRFLKEGTDPLSPDNVLVFGNGYLVGTSAPESSRWVVTAKSPESCLVGDGNGGGFFGQEMRLAGFDHLVITGRAEGPTYLYLEDGRVELRDATPYWGMDTLDVQDAFRMDLGNVEAAVCGVSGERLVRFACVRNGMKTSARTGGGAVMGSKNLKAVVARGSIDIAIDHPLEFLQACNEIKDYVHRSKVVKTLGRFGTAFLYDASNRIGAIRTKNSQLNQWLDTLDSHHIEEQALKMVSCASCFVHCRHRNVWGGEGPEYSTTGILGANCGVEKTEDLVKLNNLCNRLGLDTSSAGTILAWAMELYERGIIDASVTEEPLGWGDYEQMERLLYKINFREGFGDVLAESTHAWKRFGEASKDYLIAIKGLPQSDPHDCRYIKGFALGIAVASRGADHLRNRPTLEIFTTLPLEVKEGIYGAGVTADPTGYVGKAMPVAWSDDMYAVIDNVGICKFVCHGFNSPHLVGYEEVQRLLKTAASLDMTPADLRQIGRNTIDMERMFNLREGMTRADDTLPKRYFDEPLPAGLAKGHRIERDAFEKMLDEYYILRGWNLDGTLKEERRRELEDLLARTFPAEGERLEVAA